MSITAVVDIGTNSVKLTVAKVDGSIQIVKEASRITRLGKDVDRDGELKESAIASTLQAVEEFVTEAQSLGATKIIAAGTSALRDAKNGRELTDAIVRSTDVTVEIIVGVREADLAFKAVSMDPEFDIPGKGRLLVFDIGGGSTELIIGQERHVVDHTSLNIGAVRLTERHFRNDPITIAEYAAAADDARQSIASFLTNVGTIDVLCGVGGTATTFAGLVLQTKEIHGKVIPLSLLESCVDKLRSTSLLQRKSLPFLDPQRADIIVAGGAILVTLMQLSGQTGFRVSVRGMRYGLLLEQITTDESV